MHLSPHSPATGRPGGTVAHFHNALDTSQRTVFRAPMCATLQDSAPRTHLPTVCQLNGEFVLAEDWEHIELEEGDHAAFFMLPQGGGGDASSVQVVLGIVLVVVGVVVPGVQGLIGAGAALLVSGLMPAPETVPITAPQPGTEPSPTYSLNLSGNSARLGQAIPVLYGRHIITPDFAANAYTEFDANGDQFYNALFCSVLALPTL
jgi:sulfur carrier protein ThiS